MVLEIFPIHRMGGRQKEDLVLPRNLWQNHDRIDCSQSPEHFLSRRQEGYSISILYLQETG